MVMMKKIQRKITYGPSHIIIPAQLPQFGTISVSSATPLLALTFPTIYLNFVKYLGFSLHMDGMMILIKLMKIIHHYQNNLGIFTTKQQVLLKILNFQLMKAMSLDLGPIKIYLLHGDRAQPVRMLSVHQHTDSLN